MGSPKLQPAAKLESLPEHCPDSEEAEPEMERGSPEPHSSEAWIKPCLKLPWVT